MSIQPSHPAIELDAMVGTAVDAVVDMLPPAILNHSVRTAIYATYLCPPGGLDEDGARALAAACVFHDLGARPGRRASTRFEVDGAELAVRQARELGIAQGYLRDVWLGVALHTSAQIAEGAGPIPRLVRLGVQTDFGEALVPDDVRAWVDRAHPRLDVERVLSGVIVEQALADPEARAPRNSWPRAMLAAHQSDPANPDARLDAF